MYAGKQLNLPFARPKCGMPTNPGWIFIDTVYVIRMKIHYDCFINEFFDKILIRTENYNSIGPPYGYTYDIHKIYLKDFPTEIIDCYRGYLK